MANEKRLIDANDLIERLKFKKKISEVGLHRGLQSAMSQCDKAPTVDAVEVVHARWITDDKGVTYCENCRHIDDYASVHNYCPICGANMDLED